MKKNHDRLSTYLLYPKRLFVGLLLLLFFWGFSLSLFAQCAQTIESGNVGLHTSLAVVNGQPAISYYDNNSGDLKFTPSQDPAGNNWNGPFTVDASGDVGWYISLKEVNGHPAISYYDVSNGDLKYARSINADGSSWGGAQAVDATGSVGSHTSSTLVNGYPAISYFDQSNSSLEYVRAINADGTTWGTPVTVDNNFVGQYTSLAVVNGYPAISYYDYFNQDLKYVQATDIDGTSWGATVTIDVTGGVGLYTSLAVVNGNPAISYWDQTNNDLKYVQATDADGTSWGATVVVDGTGIVGWYTSLAVVNGNPAISYYDLNNADLKYVRAADADGTSWNTASIVDGTGWVGKYTSLTVVNGNPAISYYDDTNDDLKYIRATNVDGSSWSTPAVTVDITGSVGWYTSLMVVNGQPAISYWDHTNSNLKYVRATDTNGLNWATPFIVDASGSIGQYTSLIVANGHPAISYWDQTNNDLKYIRAADANGAYWGPTVIDAINDVGQYASLAVVNGNPAISYRDFTTNTLKYVRANDANGSSWPTPITIGGAGSGGLYTSLAVVNGYPAIAYRSGSNYLEYVIATDMNGTTWGTPVIVDNSVPTGWGTSLAVVNGHPAISYYSWVPKELKYVRATNASGSTWGGPMLIDALGSVGFGNTTLKVVNGKPAISYVGNSSLKYVRARDVDGSQMDSPITIEVSGSAYPSLAVVNGGPAISYYTSSGLKFTNMDYNQPAHNALDFDGTDDAVQATKVYTSQVDDITMEAWVNWSGSSGYLPIMFNGSTWDGYGLALNNPSGQVYITFRGFPNYNTGVNITSGAWTHLALVRDGGTWYFYVNGVDQNISLTTTPNTPTGTFKIGSDNNTPTPYFSGAMADVRLWDVARSAAEIHGNMLTPPPAGTPNLVAHYLMEQNNDCLQSLIEVNNYLNAQMYGPLGSNNLPQFYPAGPLPVELTSFRVSADGNRAVLEWETALEENNAGFEIQRSDDAITFRPIGWIEGVGTTETANNYSYIDEFPLEGVNYYRLKQIDDDGHYAFSDIQSVRFDGVIKSEDVQVYPNPVDQILNINYPESDHLRSIELFNMQGKKVRSFDLQNKQLRVSSLPAGIYLLRISINDQMITKKIVVL